MTGNSEQVVLLTTIYGWYKNKMCKIRTKINKKWMKTDLPNDSTRDFGCCNGFRNIVTTLRLHNQFSIFLFFIILLSKQLFLSFSNISKSIHRYLYSCIVFLFSFSGSKDCVIYWTQRFEYYSFQTQKLRSSWTELVPISFLHSNIIYFNNQTNSLVSN